MYLSLNIYYNKLLECDCKGRHEVDAATPSRVSWFCVYPVTFLSVSAVLLRVLNVSRCLKIGFLASKNNTFPFRSIL